MMLFQRSISRQVVVALVAAATAVSWTSSVTALPSSSSSSSSSSSREEATAVNLRHSQQSHESHQQQQRSLQTNANANANGSTNTNTNTNTFLTNLLANHVDVDVEFITVTTNTSTSTGTSTGTNTGTGDAEQQQLELEPNVLFRLFYQSWMSDTDFATVDAVCAYNDDTGTGTTPATELSGVDANVNGDNSDVMSNLAQTAAATASSYGNACLLSGNSDSDLDSTMGNWVCRTLYDPVTGVPSVSSVCAVPAITLATDQCGCCDTNDTNTNSCPTPPEQRQQQCACPCNLTGGQDDGTGDGNGVLVQVQQQQQSTSTSTSASSPATVDRCMRQQVAADRIAGNSERYTCVTTCAQAQQLERRQRQRQRLRRRRTQTAMSSSSNNFVPGPDFTNYNNALDSLDSILTDAFSAATNAASNTNTNTAGEGIIDVSGGSVSAAGSSTSFGAYFGNHADGSPLDASSSSATGGTDVGFVTNSSSVTLSSSITVTPAGGNNVNVGGNAIGNTANANTNTNTNANDIQDAVDANAAAIQNSTDEFIDNLTDIADQVVDDLNNNAANTGSSGLGSAIGDAVGTGTGTSVVGNVQDVIQDFRDTMFDPISNIQAAPRNLNSVFDMNVPGFIGDIFNGIDFQEFLDSLPQQFPVTNLNPDAPFGGILRAGESGSPPGAFLYNTFYQNWVEDTLFVNVSTCPAVENEPECVANSQGDTGRWTCRTLFHPVSGTPKSFSICGDTRRTLGTDQCGCCGGACPAACTCPCNLRGRGEGTGVLVKVGAASNSCMSPAMALKFTERNPSSFQCIDECSSI
jgi:hypothetical protein